MLMKFFARPNVLKYAQSINDVTIAAVKEFLPTVNGDVQINVEEMYATMTLRNFMRFCCSMDFSDNQTFERKLCHMISQGSNSVGRIITFNLPLNPLIPHVARADKVVKTLVEVFTPIVGARRSLVALGTAPSDPLTQMVSHGLSDREIFEHLQTLVCAGHDTTAYFLSYMTYMLAMNPDKQEKLHRCLQDIGGTTDYFVEPDALAKCQYLQYVMMETLRLFAVIPAVSRVASKDVEFKDFNVTIPQGTNILIPFFVVNRDPELWENPVQFCPERFEGRGIDFTSAKDGFFPFSYGSRTCIGNMFAHVEAEIVISHLLLRYRFAADPTFKPIVTAGISLTTANGMRVIVQPR
eukprot:gene12600-9014_t